MAKNAGKDFENDLQISCKSTKPKIFFYRIKDQSVPIELRGKVPVSKNKFDCLIFDSGYLFTLELKSTANKSVSFDEKIIKHHQIDNLLEATEYDSIISGFIFNFRNYENGTYFVPIKEFIKYKNVAENEIVDHTYVKVNKSSIPLEVCEQIGIKIGSMKKKVKYHYYVKKFIIEAIELHGEC